MKLGVLDAVFSFNYGFCSKLTIYKKLELKLSSTTVNALRDLDFTRIKRADKAAKWLKRNGLQELKENALVEEEENADDPQY
ncbi:hypothetical protein J6590_069446, partial [Homalodisca vitripennis]